MKRQMRIVAAGSILGVAFPLVGPTAVPELAAPASAAAWTSCTKKLDGVKTTLARKQRTVTIVNQTSKTHARVSFWVRRDGKKCTVTRKFLTTKARIGYGGTVAASKRRQSTGTTPLGTFSMTEAFGNGPAPGMWLPYHRVRSGDYWVQDNKSRYYNTLRNKSKGGFRYWLSGSNKNGSEYLPDYQGQYRYVVVINFNRQPLAVRYRGAGIFLHVKGDGATAGCVAISKKQMRTVMAYLKSGDKITIAR